MSSLNAAPPHSTEYSCWCYDWSTDTNYFPNNVPSIFLTVHPISLVGGSDHL